MVAVFQRQQYLKIFLILLALLAGTRAARAQSNQLIITDLAGGRLSPASSTVMAGGKVSLTLTGYNGVVVGYQYDTGNGFVDLDDTSLGIMFQQLRVTTRFRALVRSLNGVVVPSSVATVYVVDAPTDAVPLSTTAPTASPAPAAAANGHRTDAPADTTQLLESRQASFAPALTLKFSPLATLDPIASTLLVGAEYRLTPRYGVEASYGRQFDDFQLVTLGLTKGRFDYQYSKYKLELRRYLQSRTRNPNRETYFAIQGAFMPQRYTRYGNNFYRNGRYVTYDRAFVEKDVAVLGMKAGALWHLRTHWLLEAGLGLGLRYVDTRYDMLNERRLNNGGESQANYFNQIEKPSTVGTIDIELVFKVGYLLRFR